MTEFQKIIQKIFERDQEANKQAVRPEWNPDEFVIFVCESVFKINQADNYNEKYKSASEFKRGLALMDQAATDNWIGELYKTFLAKNNDYGNAVCCKPVLNTKISSLNAVLVRTSDKISRLLNLVRIGRDPYCESITDTIDDLYNYLTIYQALLYCNHCKINPNEEGVN
jgi:CobQ-like glutamine amidotransferase family enzyme